jgi:hypothetical protein
MSISSAHQSAKARTGCYRLHIERARQGFTMFTRRALVIEPHYAESQGRARALQHT